MGKEIVLFASEEKSNVRNVASFLHQMADKLLEQEVVLRQGNEELKISVPANVTLEIKVEEEEKKGKTQRSLEIEIEWYEGDESGGGVTLG
jgi:amphi-Trp domain-containing protein